jgi:hypothetical protein
VINTVTEVSMGTSIQVVFAASDPGRLADFWRTALHYEVEPPPQGYATWEEFAEAHGIQLEAETDIDSAIDPNGVGPRLLFERDDPHPRGAIHLDINAVGMEIRSAEERKSMIDAEVARLTAAGATPLGWSTARAGTG